MAKVGAYEAKTHLPALLDRVEKGETITITKHGREVATLSPWRHGGTPVDVVDGLIAARKGIRLKGVSVRELIDDGRR